MHNPVRILSNFEGLSHTARAAGSSIFEYTGSDGAIRFLARCLHSDLVIINIDTKKLLLSCALKWIMPFLRFRIVSVDLILRTPRSFRARVLARIKRALFKKVSRFILYFKNVEGCDRFYGIDAERVVYVPFKVNSWEKLEHETPPTNEGEYVLCAGRSLRDVKTFVEAMREVTCPGILLQQNSELLSGNGTESWSGELPANLRLVIDEGNQQETFIRYLSNARMVVIPRFKHDIAASGISTYLLAMALNRCVIISEGPGANDVLTDEAVIVPPEDPEMLAAQINLLWNDTAARVALATRGREYAARAAGEARLFRDILRSSLDYFGEGKPSSEALANSRA